MAKIIYNIGIYYKINIHKIINYFILYKSEYLYIGRESDKIPYQHKAICPYFTLQ